MGQYAEAPPEHAGGVHGRFRQRYDGNVDRLAQLFEDRVEKAPDRDRVIAFPLGTYDAFKSWKLFRNQSICNPG